MDYEAGIKIGAPIYKAFFFGDSISYFGYAMPSAAGSSNWNKMSVGYDSWQVQVKNTSSANATLTISVFNSDDEEISLPSAVTNAVIASGASAEYQFSSFNPAIKVAITGTGGDVDSNPVKVYVSNYTRFASPAPYGAMVSAGVDNV